MKTKTPEANNNFGKSVEEMKIPHKHSCGALVNPKADGSYEIACGDDLGGFNNEFYQCADCRKKDIDEFNSQQTKSKAEQLDAQECGMIGLNSEPKNSLKGAFMLKNKTVEIVTDGQESKSGLSICQNVNSESSPDFQQKLNEIEKGCGIMNEELDTCYAGCLCGGKNQLKWLCLNCQAERKGLIQGYLMAINEEIENINHQLKMIDVEMKLAIKANTNSGSQSALILYMWVVQDKKRLQELTKIKSELEKR